MLRRRRKAVVDERAEVGRGLASGNMGRVRDQDTRPVAAKVSDLDFAEICGNSADISKGFFQSGMRKFDPWKVSQPLSQLKIVCVTVTKSPRNTGFLEFCEMSPDSDKEQLSREIA